MLFPAGPWENLPENVHTSFSFFIIPYAIPVPDGLYRVKIGKHTAEISLRRVQNIQIMRAYNVRANSLQFPFDKYGKSAKSFIEIEIPFKINLMERGRQSLLLGDSPPKSKEKELVLPFLNRFIETIRYVTQEYWIEPIRYQDITEYKVSYWDGTKVLCEVDSGFSLGIGGVIVGSGHPFVLNDEKMLELKNYLENEYTLDISNILLLNSKDACLQEDFRLATIEAVTALEIVLYRFFRKQSKKLGIPDERLNEFIVNVGLTGNINVVLKMLTKDMEQIDDETIPTCTGAITARNKILHEGLHEVIPNETEKRIISIEKMIAYLKRLINYT